jgi:hypothetical protein
MHRHSLVLCAAALVISSGAIAAHVDVPPDGHAPRAIRDAGPAIAPAGEPPTLPFGATPDWQNDIRVQVGGLAFGDLDGDDLPDLALVCYQSNSFPPYEDWRNFVYFNQGDALETQASWVSDDERHSGDAAVGDVDGDGFNDLVVANGGGGYAPNAIYFGSEGGLATAPGWLSEQPAWATSLELFDIDDDGDLDLLTTNQGAGQGDSYRPMYLFRNGQGVLETVPSWQSAEASIQNDAAVGDIDGDGDPDIGAAKWVDFESAIHINVDGTPETTPSWTTGTTDGDRGIEFADMDGDSDLDIVLGVDDTLKIFRNDGDGDYVDVWTAAQTANHQDLLVADFDGDGLPDIVDIDFSTGRAHLYLNTASLPATAPVWSYDAPGSGTALAAADVDGDGMLDLAIGYSGTPSAVIFYNQLEPAGPDDVIFANGFELPAPAECGWNTALGTPGGSVGSIGVWNEELYVGASGAGSFGGVPGGVQRVDIATGTVSALGTTTLVDGFVTDFVPYDDGDGERLFIAGAFNGISFDGSELPDSRGLVAWDGTVTTTVPDQPFAQPLSFAQTATVWNDRLVVGGSRGAVEPPQKPLLALWDGTDWTEYHDEFEGTIAPVLLASAVYDGALYIGGRFARIRIPDGIGGETVTESVNVMGFDGSAFFSVGGGVNRSSSPVSQVLALKAFDNGDGEALYIGGRFDQSVSGTPLFAVAKWDGTALSAVGAGFPMPNEIRAFEIFDDGTGAALYAVGTFTADTAGAPMRRMAKLVGSEWIEVAGGTGENPNRARALPDGTLAVAGSFTEVGVVDVVPGSGASNGVAVLECGVPE